jgi:hypothetical protein
MIFRIVCAGRDSAGMSDPLNAERSEVIRPRSGFFLDPAGGPRGKIADTPNALSRIGAIAASQLAIAIESPKRQPPMKITAGAAPRAAPSLPAIADQHRRTQLHSTKVPGADVAFLTATVLNRVDAAETHNVCSTPQLCH